MQIMKMKTCQNSPSAPPHVIFGLKTGSWGVMREPIFAPTRWLGKRIMSLLAIYLTYPPFFNPTHFLTHFLFFSFSLLSLFTFSHFDTFCVLCILMILSFFHFYAIIVIRPYCVTKCPFF